MDVEIRPVIPGYTWRFARLEDIPGVYQLLIDAAAADHTSAADNLQDMVQQFNDPWSRPETDFLLAFTPSGQVAAMARVFVNPSPRTERNAQLWGEVHPMHRGRGLGEYAFTWMEKRANQRLQEYPNDLPRTLRTTCFDHRQDRIKLFKQHGFQPKRSWFRMRRDLHQPIPDETLPPGLTMSTYRPDLDQGVWNAFNESFSDHWGFEPVPYEDWQMFFTHTATFRPELTLIAFDGAGAAAQIAGFCLNCVRDEENQRQSLLEGWVAELGVCRPWRKRGIASALLCQSMRAFKATGLDYAGLGVDTENTTGALRIYERLGFTVFQRTVTYAKPFENGD